MTTNQAKHSINFAEWQPAKPSLEEWMEGASLRVANRLYVIGGYQTLTKMCPRMQICDIESGEWTYGPELPAGFPLSHAGIASDGRFLFFVSGQPGPACEHATDRCWALDLKTMAWQQMAPLPGARFAPVLEYLDGNLHLISGATEDRVTICGDHFVMKIRNKDDQVSSLPDIEMQVWREAPPVPEGGDHAGSVVYDSRIYMIGGEHGHAGVTMDAAACCGTYCAHNFLFRYDPRTEQWERLADMLFGTSHIEAQILIVDDRIVVLGGTGDQDILVDRVQEYDPAENSWTELSPLPQGRKGGLVWQWKHTVYFNGGQIGEKVGTEVVATTMASKIERVSSSSEQ